MTEPYIWTDLGVTFGDAILCSIKDAIALNDLPMPQQVYQLPGAQIPADDACDGLLWVRLATQFATDGSGQPFAMARAAMGAIPAWLYRFEVGYGNCVQVIEENGEAPEPAYWTEMAGRDGQLRMSVLRGLTQLLPPRIQNCADALIINQFTPYGPDGMWVGGTFMVDLISMSLAN